LASGEPDFATPLHIQRALAEAVEAGGTHYAAWNGDPELRSALAVQVSRPGRLDRSPAEVIVTHGGSGALSAAVLSCINPHDRVIIPTPTYSLYADLVRLAGGEPVFVSQTDDFHLDLDAISAVAQGARMVVICNPCNPTGVVYGEAELVELAELAQQHELLVLCDEAYDQIVYDACDFTSVLDVPVLAERVLYAQTFSKTYAMTGWRVGYLVGPAEVVDAAAVVHRSLTGPLNTAVQRAALAAITGPQDPVAQRLREYRERREIVVTELADTPGASLRAPQGTFYAFVRHDPRMTSGQVAALAREYGVAVRPGSEFGPKDKGYVRLSFATDRDTLIAGLHRLRDVLTMVAES
jgi:aspartate aminotransferase